MAFTIARNCADGDGRSPLRRIVSRQEEWAGRDAEARDIMHMRALMASKGRNPASPTQRRSLLLRRRCGMRLFCVELTERRSAII
jgi:hypothetical protein